MYPRVNYEMTEEDEKQLLAAMQPQPVMMIGNCVGPSVQDRANAAWADLGLRMGFDYMTVRPIEGKGQRFFTAVPSETPEQRAERLLEEKHTARMVRAAEINVEINRLRRELSDLND